MFVQETKQARHSHPLAMSDKEWRALPQDMKEEIQIHWNGLSQKERESELENKEEIKNKIQKAVQKRKEETREAIVEGAIHNLYRNK